MKSIIAALVLTPTLLASSPAPQDAGGAVGRWKTQTRNAIVEIQRCGASLCGRILTSDALRADPNFKDKNNRNAALRNRQLRGLQILGGFKQQGNGWYGGTIYNAEDGKTYTAYVTPEGPNQLKVKGCVFRPLCKTQTWTRVR